jgi:hypothetical protein
MLTENDLIQLRSLLFSDRVTWRGNEISGVLELSARINGQIKSMKAPKEDDVSHSPGLTE